MRGKRSPSDGRTQAHPALSSVGIPQRVCLPPPPCLCPCPPRLRVSFPVQADHAKENHLRSSCSPLLLPFSPTCYTKRTVHMETIRFSVQLGRMCGKPPFLRKKTSPAVSFVSFLQEKKSSPLPFLSRKKRKQKKVICGTVFSAAVAFFANVLHKTDGSYGNRPFFCTIGSDVRETSFSPKENLPRSVFCFFSSRKENVPPLIRRKENVPTSFSIYANKQSKTHGHMQTVRFGRCCVLSEKTEKSECVPRAAGSPPPTVGGPRRMQRRVQRSSASCTGRSPYRACPV